MCTLTFWAGGGVVFEDLSPLCKDICWKWRWGFAQNLDNIFDTYSSVVFNRCSKIIYKANEWEMGKAKSLVESVQIPANSTSDCNSCLRSSDLRLWKTISRPRQGVVRCAFFFFFLKCLEDKCGATDIPVLHFWWRLPWVSKLGWIHAFLPTYYGFLRFILVTNPRPRVHLHKALYHSANPARPLHIYVNTVPGSRSRRTKCCFISKQSSFPITHKVSAVGIFVLLKFETRFNREISWLNLNSKLCDKYKLALKVLRLCFWFISFRICAMPTLSTVRATENSNAEASRAQRRQGVFSSQQC